MYTVASAPAVRDRLGLDTHRFNFFLGGGDAVLSCLEVSRKKAVFDILVFEQKMSAATPLFINTPDYMTPSFDERRKFS